MTQDPSAFHRLILLGGGGHALVVHEAALALGMEVVGVYDDNPRCNLATRTRVPCLGRFDSVSCTMEGAWIVALGDIPSRRRLIDRLPTIPGSMRAIISCLAHPRAYLSPTSTLGPGVFAGPLVCVHSFATIGAHCIINTGAIIEHECVLGENVHVAPNSTLGGNVAVGNDTLIGLGAAVLPGVKIGRGCMIGAGAVVRRDVPDGARVVGVPAR